MGLKKLTEKIADYNRRLEQGKASKIKPSHVRQVLHKLQARKRALEDELEATPDEQERARLEQRLSIAREHIARAEWLLKEFS